MTGLGIRTAALPAWRDLHVALSNTDRPTPCQANPDAWTGDGDSDMADAAAQLCQEWCPALAECNTFATVNRESSGIWAGIDRTPRRGRPAAQRQEETG